jgi:hypothetical protein
MTPTTMERITKYPTAIRIGVKKNHLLKINTYGDGANSPPPAEPN